jgi:uncharacterized membrane protein (UPF0127 family)
MTHFSIPRGALLACLAMLPGVAAAQNTIAQNTIALSIGIHRIEAEVAASPQTLATGLMNRRSLPAHRGMLFLFPKPERQCMWMRNTLIPLSVAFMDAEGRILNIADMQPRSETQHCSSGPAVYALELNRGWFQQRGIEKGSLVAGLRDPKPFR